MRPDRTGNEEEDSAPGRTGTEEVELAAIGQEAWRDRHLAAQDMIRASPLAAQGQ